MAFEGNGGFLSGTSDYHLRGAIEQQDSPWFSTFAPARAVALDRGALAQDAWRLETWYGHRGYLDARFMGWDLHQVRPARGQRPAVYVVTGRVEEGEPSLVREVSYVGLVVGGSRIHEGYVRRTAPVQPGGRFHLEDVEETQGLIHGWLREHGFPFVYVEPEVDAWPEEHAVDVRFTVDKGPLCRFGTTRVEGNRDVPEALIRTRIAWEEGATFKASLVDRTRRELFALGVFSAVQVRTLDPEGEECVLPVVLDLTESRFQRLRTGVGVGMESGRQDVHVVGAWRHANLAHRLMTLDVAAEVGAVALGTFYGGDAAPEVAPMVDTSAHLSVPRVPGPLWTFDQAVTYEQGLESGFRYATPAVEPSLTRVWFPDGDGPWELGKVNLTTAWRLRYFDYLDLPVGLDRTESRLGLDLTDPYLLSFLEERVLWDARDDPLFTRRGMYLAAGAGMAGGPIGGIGAPLFGQFDYVRAFADLRGYRSLARLFGTAEGVVVAGRLAGGTAVPLGSGDRAAVPYAERFRIGGGSTVRGWVTDHLGPYLCARDGDGGGTDYEAMCAPSEADVASGAVEIVPTGGQVYALGSLEVRKPTIWGIGAAAFFDAGMAWNSWAELGTYGLQPSVGGGLRYASPVGPIRLDVGFRLRRDGPWQHEPAWNLHFALAEAF